MSGDAPYRLNVGVLLFNPDGLVFVGRRTDTRDAWQMPQGGIDPGEDPAAAALREMAEEVGTDKGEIVGETRDWLAYDLPSELQGRLWSGRYRGQKQKWFAVRFTGTDADIDLAAHEPEFDAWRWVALEEVPRLIVPFKRPVYERVIAELGPLVRPYGRRA